MHWSLWVQLKMFRRHISMSLHISLPFKHIKKTYNTLLLPTYNVGRVISVFSNWATLFGGSLTLEEQMDCLLSPPASQFLGEQHSSWHAGSCGALKHIVIFWYYIKWWWSWWDKRIQLFCLLVIWSSSLLLCWVFTHALLAASPL